MKKEIRLSTKDTLKSAIMAQWEEQQKLSQKFSEKLLNTLTIKDLKKIHTMNEITLQTIKKADLKEMTKMVKFSLSFMN